MSSVVGVACSFEESLPFQGSEGKTSACRNDGEVACREVMERGKSFSLLKSLHSSLNASWICWIALPLLLHKECRVVIWNKANSLRTDNIIIRPQTTELSY